LSFGYQKDGNTPSNSASGKPLFPPEMAEHKIPPRAKRRRHLWGCTHRPFHRGRRHGLIGCSCFYLSSLPLWFIANLHDWDMIFEELGSYRVSVCLNKTLLNTMNLTYFLCSIKESPHFLAFHPLLHYHFSLHSSILPPLWVADCVQIISKNYAVSPEFPTTLENPRLPRREGLEQ